MDPTHLVAATNIIWKVLEGHGHNPEPIFHQAGIDPKQFLKPGSRVPFRAVDTVWLKAAELIQDPCFGLSAVNYWHPSYLDALGFSWLASITLRRALKRLVRYSRIVSEGFVAGLEETRKGLTLTIQLKPTYAEIPAASDATLAILVHMCRLNYGEGLAPAEVTFAHAEQRCAEQYHAYFRSPVKFGAGRDSITLPVAAVDRRLPSGNLHLAELNDQLIVKYLENLDSSDIVQRVKGAIIETLSSGAVSDEKIATTLHLSVRNLQRKLQRAGTTFRTILDETRRELAEQYLQDPDTRLDELTFVLGFSEQSAFSRAFKRWTGRSPSQVRSSG
ncbi:MAG: AraC family transcriptional regulator [Deltaproteobacteria bacterium]|nr:AraC family transcriptional regulator [Deltaproteobacteria bacterium]